ncbi:MAG: hypothetical protein ACREUG_07285, partial [Steroidobacteraceae bacterium]
MALLASGLEHFPNQNRGICPERVGVLAELEHIQLSLPGFDFPDKGMGSIETTGELALRDTGGLSGRLECGYQCFVTRGAQVLANPIRPNQWHQGSATAPCSNRVYGLL